MFNIGISDVKRSVSFYGAKIIKINITNTIKRLFFLKSFHFYNYSVQIKVSKRQFGIKRLNAITGGNPL